MDVGRAEVLRIAALARVALSDEEADRLGRDLQDILDHVDALPEVAHAGSGPTESGADGIDAAESDLRGTRPDEPGADPLAGGIEAFAPEVRDGFFTVPRLVSHADTDRE